MHNIVKNFLWVSVLFVSNNSVVAMEKLGRQYPDNFYRMCEANLMTEADLISFTQSYLRKFEQAYKQYYFAFFDDAAFDSIFEPLVREMLQLNPRKDLYDLIPSIARNAMNLFVEHCVVTEGGPYGKRLAGGYEEERYEIIYNNLVQKKCEQTRRRPDQLTEVEKKELATAAANRNSCACHIFIYWVEDLNGGRSKLQALASRVADELDALDGQCSYSRACNPQAAVEPDLLAVPNEYKKTSVADLYNDFCLQQAASSKLKASAPIFVPGSSSSNAATVSFKPKIFTSSKKKKNIASGLTVSNLRTQLSTIEEVSQSQELEEGSCLAAQAMQATSEENGFDSELSAIEDGLTFSQLRLDEQAALGSLLEEE